MNDQSGSQVTLNLDQRRREELLLKALEKYQDVDVALTVAQRMEHFILFGNRRDGVRASDAASPDAVSQTGAVRPPKRDLNGSKRRWTEQDKEKLLDLWRQNLTVEEIAAHLERTLPSVRIHARRLGLSRRGRKANVASDALPPESSAH